MEQTVDSQLEHQDTFSMRVSNGLPLKKDWHKQVKNKFDEKEFQSKDTDPSQIWEEFKTFQSILRRFIYILIVPFDEYRFNNH